MLITTGYRRPHFGQALSTDTFVKVPTPGNPNRVYGADVCYVAYANLAKDAPIPDGVLPVTPDLVIETRGPSDAWAEVFGKAQDYLNAGGPVVVVLDPGTKTASVCTPPFDRRVVGPADTLTIPEVLPGFAVPVAALFG
ncbi:MAG: Uma2 family endonuclease [Gemmataceae bacterium]|nr:Uma2 family endonuclease [Gemmataceae bacterium]